MKTLHEMKMKLQIAIYLLLVPFTAGAQAPAPNASATAQPTPLEMKIVIDGKVLPAEEVGAAAIAAQIIQQQNQNDASIRQLLTQGAQNVPADKIKAALGDNLAVIQAKLDVRGGAVKQPQPSATPKKK